jgi:Ran GTPase-activating protein (RanGAP) involved in mRNA processing and transport
MSDAELVPELSQLPDDRTLVLLLNGNDMLREGAEEINRLLLAGKRIQSLQLQWNLLGSEGAAALVPGLSMTKFLRFVDLTGNELEEEGAIALAAGIKENNSIQSLVIPENQIGNEGITVIAHALKHNTTLQTLDVSNNNIFEEGCTFLGGVLENENKTLVELRLTGNCLRDQGASAIARAVAVHPVLEHVELRNAIIDDEGIIDLCNAIMNNPANNFEYLDLSLNNFSIRSELYMQDLLMNSFKADVHWKELDASRLFEIDEIDAIVDHFGVATIIDKYLREETLLPLIPFDVLLPNISFNDPELSDGLVANVLDKLSVSRTLFIRGMDLLNILLYHLTSSDAIITTITENHVIDSIFARLPDFVDILTSARFNNVFPSGAPPAKPRLGFVRFKTLELLVNLMKFNNAHLHEQLVEHRVISHLLDLMFAWPDNNFVHHQIKDLIVIILYSQSEILLTDLLIGAKLPQRIIGTYNEQMDLDVGFHKGFFGHLTEMANYIATSLPTFHFMKSYDDWKTWDIFVTGNLETTNVILETSYEGCEELSP